MDFEQQTPRKHSLGALRKAKNVNRRWTGTPDQHPKGTPLSYVSNG
jgi:hypothetical protein